MKKNTGLKFAILSLSFTLMIRLTISPALPEIGKAFPSVSQGALMNMVAMASLFAIPTGFISGLLAKKMKKKTLVMIGLVLYMIGGLGPIISNSFMSILVFRAILGIGIGFYLPMCTGLIADFFTGDERNHLLGLQNTFVATGNIITSLLAGFLAVISWRLSFLIYAFAAIVLLLVIFKLQEPERVHYDSAAENKTVNKGVMYICFGIFLYAICYFSYFGYLSYAVESHHFGDSSTSGIAQMLLTVAQLIMGFVFLKLLKLFKRSALFIAILLNAVGYFIMGIATNISFIFVGSIIIGIGFGLLMPLGMSMISDVAPKSALTFANGLYMVFMNLGTAIAPTVLVLLAKLFNNNDGLFVFKSVAIALMVGAVLALIGTLIGKNSTAERQKAVNS